MPEVAPRHGAATHQGYSTALAPYSPPPAQVLIEPVGYLPKIKNDGLGDPLL